MQLFIFHWTRVRSLPGHLLSPSLLFCRRSWWLVVVKIITKKILVLLLLLMLMLMLSKALTTGWWRLITLLQQLFGSFVNLTTFWSKLRGNLFIALGYVVPLAMFHGPSRQGDAILSQIKICRDLRSFWRSLGKKSAFLGQKQCFLGKKCTITWYILHIILN